MLSNAVPTPNLCYIMQPESEEEEEQLDEDIEESEDEGSLLEDNESERCYDAGYYGKKIEDLYVNIWFNDELEYFNIYFQKYMALFPDESEDYVGEEKIDGDQIQIVQ